MELYKKQNTKSDNKKSYAEVIINAKPPPKRIPRITVKKINKGDDVNTKERITHCLTNEKSIQSKQIYIKNKDEIIINCMSQNSVNITEQFLQKELPSSCVVQIEQLMKPKMKIVGIDNVTKMDKKKWNKTLAAGTLTRIRQNVLYYTCIQTKIMDWTALLLKLLQMPINR